MAGTNRTFVLVLASLLLVAPATRAQTAAPATPVTDPQAKAPEKAEDRAKLFALPGEDPPQPFVPIKPRTVEDRRLLEAASEYTAARALEERHALPDAIALLEKALEDEPDSVAVLRRLSRICFAVGRTEQAIKYSKQALEFNPDDTDTISRLVAFYTSNRRGSNAVAAEELLKGLLGNPNLDKHSAGHLLAEYELGKLYANKLQQPEKAADAFTQVVDALDERAANRLSPKDQRLVLGNDPEEAYLEFGDVFLAARRPELAIKAFQHGLVYAPDHPQIRVKLAQTLLELGRPQEALDVIESHIKRQPQGREGYELLAKALTALGRAGEITPRLEEAARLDAQNLPLQYSLADRYRETGQTAKAEALYKKLLESTPTPQGYAALADSLFQRRQTDDLVRVITQALTRFQNQPRDAGIAVDSVLKKIVDAPEYAGEVIDAGRKLLTAEPPAIDRAVGTDLLVHVATNSKDPKNLEKFLPVQRLALRWNPTPATYRQLAGVLSLVHKPAEAAEVVEQLMEKFPDERNVQMLDELATLLLSADDKEKALKAEREAAKLEPRDPRLQYRLILMLVQNNKPDEALATAREMLKNDPANPIFNQAKGYVLTQFERNDEAIAFYQGLLERYPNKDEIVKVVHSGLSVVYINLGNFAKAENELEILLERDPDDPGVNNDLGYLYADQGKNLEKAEAMIRKALVDSPDNAAYLDSLGWVLYKRGNLKEAAERLEAAIKQNEESKASTDATIYEHLGDVYFQMQDMARARTAWEQAEKAGQKAIPPDRRLSEIRKKLKSLKDVGYILRPSSHDRP
jgi:tetratricopeptide (TPR) repeat protein